MARQSLTARDFQLRASANMPPLNNDGLPGYSANVRTVFADLFPPRNPRGFGQVRALNVITI